VNYCLEVMENSYKNWFGLLWLWLACALPASAFAETNDSLPIINGSVVHDYARITFEWPEAVKFSADASGKKITVTFARATRPDFGPLLSALYPYVISAEKKKDGKTLLLTLDKPYKIRTFTADNISGIDLLNIDPEERLALREHKALKQLAAIPPDAAALSALSPTAGEAQDAPQAEADQAVKKEDAEHVDPIKVSVSAAKDSAVLRLSFTERMALAVFIRDKYLWVVLSKPLPLDLSDFDNLDKTVIGKGELLAENHAMLRVPIDDNIFATVAKEESSFEWAILLTPVKRNPENPLRIDVNTDPPVPPHVFINTLQMADPVTVKDPVIGDELIAVPLYKLGEGIATNREFVEFTTLETAQGVAIAKKSDDVAVAALRNGLRISLPQGTTLTAGLPAIEATETASLQNTPTLFPYSKWQLDPIIPRATQLRIFSSKIVGNATVRGANDQRLKLAQIYLGEGLEAESIGMLDNIRRTDPAYYRSAKLAALHGAANFLMYRFNEAARDFAAPELNNNKEAEFWRNMLADLQGTPSQFDFIAMNPDYISKYPPLFRQRIAIAAADHAIDAKDYNTALKIFDSLQPGKEDDSEEADNKEKDKAKLKPKEKKEANKSKDTEDLLTPIKPYVNYLFAKIATETGQEKEGVGMWDELAKDYDHPFVQARAEFSRIVWNLNHNGMKKEEAIDHLERLHLNWHGDGLELKVLELLGDLYNEKKDYVNAMRVWNIGVTSFPSTQTAIDMSHKMQEAFAQLYNGDGMNTLPPMDALTIYYQYKSYAPSGSAGREITARLADRLIAIDLLDQAANLLDHQMRFDTDKIQRSNIGAKVASIYLTAHQPRKALAALEDSVYGENPTSLQLIRNRLIAEALFEVNEPDRAVQVIGHDDSLEAERIRLNIYWQRKEWPNVITSVEGMLKARRNANAPLTQDESEDVLKLALAYVFQNNTLQLQYLRDYFGPLMVGNPNKPIFDFVTATDVTPAPGNFDDVVKQLSATHSFIENYHARTQTAEAAPAAPAKTVKQ